MPLCRCQPFIHFRLIALEPAFAYRFQRHDEVYYLACSASHDLALWLCGDQARTGEQVGDECSSKVSSSRHIYDAQ